MVLENHLCCCDPGDAAALPTAKRNVLEPPSIMFEAAFPDVYKGSKCVCSLHAFPASQLEGLLGLHVAKRLPAKSKGEMR